MLEGSRLLAKIYPVPWIRPVRLAIAARPRSGDWLEDEISSWRAQGITAVLSCLEGYEVAELGLERESRLCADLGISFASFPIPDRGVPRSDAELLPVARDLAERAKAGAFVAVHCRAGIGRSTLVAACVMAHLRIPYARIWPALADARGVPVPDVPEQEKWVESYAKRIATAL